MFVGILSSIGFFFLFYGRFNLYLLTAISIAIIFISAVSHDHDHSLLIMENIANKSPLKFVNPIFKIIYTFFIIIFTISIDNLYISIAVWAFSLFLFLVLNKLNFDYYFDLMKFPLVFILISTLGVIISFGKTPLGFLDIKMFNFYMSISEKSQIEGINLFFKATASVSMLLTLGSTTGMGDIIYGLKKMKLPWTLIELMYLIYRYIFLLSESLNNLQAGAKNRLGFQGFSNTLRSSKYIASRLFNKSVRMSMLSYSAMESRLYNGKLEFIERIYDEKKYYPVYCGFLLFIIVLKFTVGKI